MIYGFIVIGIVAGLAIGAIGGLRAGAWARGDAVRYWSLNAVAFLGSLGLDIVGLLVRQPWLSYGSLGLMAGLITGLKYGYSPTLRVRETPPPPAEDPEDADADGQDSSRADSQTAHPVGDAPEDSDDDAAGDPPPTAGA